jgi:multidrug resistance efflux pump
VINTSIRIIGCSCLPSKSLDKSWESVFLIIIAGILISPWQNSFRRDAFIKSALYTHIFAPEPGKITNVNIRPEDDVTEGQVLMTLESPEQSISCSKRLYR